MNLIISFKKFAYILERKPSIKRIRQSTKVLDIHGGGDIGFLKILERTILRETKTNLLNETTHSAMTCFAIDKSMKTSRIISV